MTYWTKTAAQISKIFNVHKIYSTILTSFWGLQDAPETAFYILQYEISKTRYNDTVETDSWEKHCSECTKFIFDQLINRVNWRERGVVQWNRCLERVSLGMYSATKSRSSPSAQQPIRFTNLLCLTFPTPAASAYSDQSIRPNSKPQSSNR